MFVSVSDFPSFFRLSDKEIDEAEKVVSVYPARCTEYYASLASKDDFFDPIKRMVFPSIEELGQNLPDDPFKEEVQSPVPFITHKYPDRVLFVVTNFCPVLCRYCMRKRNWKTSCFEIGEDEINRAVSYIREKRIRDVLISGGEPLTIELEKLEYLLSMLKETDTVDIVRIGTKIPVVAPQFLTDKLLSILENGKKVWINTHFNHPVEITSHSREAVEKLLGIGIPVNNQSVLLKGVNDREETLFELFSDLQRIKVRPYYLFRCDPVKGVFHFATSVKEGISIMRRLRRRLSPLAIPYYAIDTCKGKMILYPDGVTGIKI